jgi:hypothetical protein
MRRCLSRLRIFILSFSSNKVEKIGGVSGEPSGPPALPEKVKGQARNVRKQPNLAA